MKIFLTVLLMLSGIAQFSLAQDVVKTPKPNSMSNVIGITGEAGATLGFTDYTTSIINYMGKGSLEYYFPSTGKGNIGLRVFGQTGFIAGRGAPVAAFNPTDKFSTKVDMYGGGVLYTLSIDDAVYPWVAFGVSNLWFYPKDNNGNLLPNYVAENYFKHMLAYNGDLGVRIMVAKNLSANVTAGLVLGSKDNLDDIRAGSNNDLFYSLTVGISYYFGRDKDSDHDGVPDSRDRCPDTPKGVQVDVFGCPLDSDNDGVPDYLDKCPNTPTGVKVDVNGCPLDADGDGVPDYLDKCPNTPTGVAVDANGCPLDSDGDGVPDYLDKCPNTPTGVQVDADGCPIKKVVEKIIIKEPAEVESLVLSGDTNFEFNKSKLLPNAFPVLDGLVGTMNKHPKYKWEIGGYTDGVGSASYNKKLSKQRAQSVVDYLVEKGINRNNLKIVGYGKENPIATNDTNEGRSMNRRVEIKILSKDNQ
jgi:OOP family OmpA-OmpF porin